MEYLERLNVDIADPTPIYAQLERAIRFAIAVGKWRIGDKLPTVRQLAVDLRVNANTVAKVYSELERAGILHTRRGVGTFVRVREFEAASWEDRMRELNALAAKFLAEAFDLGFSTEEVIAHLKSRRTEE